MPSPSRPALVPRTSPAGRAKAQRVIVRELERLLAGTRVRQVHVADGSTAPPALAYVTHFPRLSIPIEGAHTIEIARQGRTKTIRPVRGQAVFVPGNAWDRPQWSRRVTVLTCLFGQQQIGFSLVRHDGATEIPREALKTNVHGAHDALTRSILNALVVSAMDSAREPLSRLLTESLLHACVRLLKTAEPHPYRKATLTYESICLFVAENFQNRSLSRESVAERFGLAPNHISRLFSLEGSMRFNDYVNMVRVNRAKFMLQSYRMSVKEIAATCGYSDAAYFCRVFRKVTGLTPMQYRTDGA